MSWPAEHHINFLYPYMLFSLHCIFMFVLFWVRVDLKICPQWIYAGDEVGGGSSLHPDPSTFHWQQKTFAFNTTCKLQKLMHKHQKVWISIRVPGALANIHGPDDQFWTLRVGLRCLCTLPWFLPEFHHHLFYHMYSFSFFVVFLYYKFFYTVSA